MYVKNNTDKMKPRIKIHHRKPRNDLDHVNASQNIWNSQDHKVNEVGYN